MKSASTILLGEGKVVRGVKQCLEALASVHNDPHNAPVRLNGRLKRGETRHSPKERREEQRRARDRREERQRSERKVRGGKGGCDCDCDSAL
jgi:hypothetical protein